MLVTLTVNLLDPCCGKGTALSALGADADCMTYGVEIDEGRETARLMCARCSISVG